MSEFKIIFYETVTGRKPVEDFLAGLEPKMRVKMLLALDLLSERGNALREPYSKSLGDGIFELRCRLGTDQTRTLYFFFSGAKIVMTNGFIKKTPKTPPQEIELARERRADYIRRNQ